MSDVPPSPMSNIVKPQEHKRRRRRHRRFRWARRLRKRLAQVSWRLALVVVLGITAIVSMSVLLLTVSARNQVDDSWSRLSRVLDNINGKPGTELTMTDFDRLKTSVSDLSSSLNSAKRQTYFLRPFSILNTDLDTSLESLAAAHELALAASDMLNGMEPVLFFLSGGDDGDIFVPQLTSGERVVELLSLGQSLFVNAGEHLETADNTIDGLKLAEVSPDLLVTVDGLTRFHDQLEEINTLLLDSPNLLETALGINDTQTYLVLSQNSDELRPSGGYISTYGWLTVRGGRVIDYSYSATTATSPNPPPAEFADEIDIPDWWIQYQNPVFAAWDGSWYADFPSTAEMAAWYYNAGRNPKSPVDGVIGIDMIGFEYILAGLGSITVPDYGDTVTADTFREAVYRIRAEDQGDDAHKRFLAALYQQILADWQTVDREQSAELRGTVLRALQENHIMIYFADDELNEALGVWDWTGSQKPATEYDYLMVADANLGNKSNRSVARQLTYDVEIQTDGSLQCRTAVSYDYSAQAAEADPAVAPAHYSDIDYHNIMQVFVPANSLLVETNNLRVEPEIVTTETHTSFVALVQVNYNSSERFQFSYSTPVLVDSFGPYRRYTLLIQKQPGMVGEPVNVQITLPENTETIYASPEAAASYDLENQILEFRLELVTDHWIEVIYTQR